MIYKTERTMSSIITITFNPTIDKSTSVAALMPERKLKCTEPVYEPGGGGINVSRAIKKLGGESTAVYLAGGYSGKSFTNLLDKEFISSIIIETADSTRENLIVVEKTSNQQYRFGMPGPSVQEHEWRKCLVAIENVKDVDYIVASGSLPRGVPIDIFARIATIAKKKNAKFIVDTSGEALKNAVNEGVYLIKPNLGELSSLVGKEELNIELVDDVARTIIDKGNCEVIIVSMGPAGAMLVTKDTALHILPPVVIRKSTVGAGDSMVAGIVLSLSTNKTLSEAVRYGVACGTAATMNPGTELCRLQDAEDIYSMIQKMSINK
jgi:6-phosphofructokinase 2